MVDRDQLRSIILGAVHEANAPVLARLAKLEARVEEVERGTREHVSNADLSHQAEQASMIVHMRKLEVQLTESNKRAEDAHKRADEAHKHARSKLVLHGLVRASISALATALGAYLAVKGIHL